MLPSVIPLKITPQLLFFIQEKINYINLLILSISILSLITEIVIIGVVITVMKNLNIMKLNYRNRKIFPSIGIVLVLNSFFWYIIALLLVPKLDPIAVRFCVYFLCLFLFIGLIGLVDDIFGNIENKGIISHFKKLIVDKKITSGVMKAFSGLIVGLVSALIIEIFTIRSMYKFQDERLLTYINNLLHFNHPIWLLVMIILDTLIITLSINFINLLDLRPSRAIKGFFVSLIFGSIIIIGVTQSLKFFILYYRMIYLTLFPIIISIVAYAYFDFREITIMGDTGSNFLGFTFGFFFCAYLSLISTMSVINLYCKLIMVIFLIAIHIYCEFYSLSKLIDKIWILKWWDRIGTPG